jgi:hypothetical protein
MLHDLIFAELAGQREQLLRAAAEAHRVLDGRRRQRRLRVRLGAAVMRLGLIVAGGARRPAWQA